ncbi:unnamed protein product [Orchesella dallaii]|uniref:Uncharacterized protein n=1 Tax=Orchesella dallaii TaxID=48710 RepID=A0ABP1Q5F1_9HEXA
MENALNRENVLAIVDELRNVIHKSFSSSERLQIDMEAEMRRLREMVASYKQTIYELEEKLNGPQEEQNQLQHLEKAVIALQEKAKHMNECLTAESAKTKMVTDELVKLKEKYQQMLDVVNAYELKLPKLQTEVEQCHKLLDSLQPIVHDLKINDERMRLSLNMHADCHDKFQKLCDKDLESDIDVQTSSRIDTPAPRLKFKYEETERDSDDDEKPECEHPSSSSTELHQNRHDLKLKDEQEADTIYEEKEQEIENMDQKLRNINEQTQRLAQEENPKTVVFASAQQLQGLWEKFQFFE